MHTHQAIDPREGRAGEHRLVVLPFGRPALSSHRVVGGVALDHRRPGAQGGVLRKVGDLVVEEDQPAVRLDERIQPAQRLGPVHPVEGSAHGHRPESSPLGGECLRAPLSHLDCNTGATDAFARMAEHLRLRIDGEDGADVGCEG